MTVKRSIGKVLYRLGSTLCAEGERLPPEVVNGKIYISGTGRAGTTLLVQILTEMGCDTGFAGLSLSEASANSIYFPSARAGFERDIFDKNGPQIVKCPFLCDQVDEVLASGIRIGHVIIPVREFASASKSRKLVQLETTGEVDGPSVAGGLWDTNRADDQEVILRSKLANLVEACVRNHIPMTFLSFPRFARDPDYLLDNLRFLLPLVTRAEFRRAFYNVTRMALIHEFRS